MPLPRFELKYPISEATALAVRSYVRSFLDLDRYVTDRETLSYCVDSLYLDSADLKTFWGGVNGGGRRYKLRVRTYDECPDSPVFFEVKRCIDDKIVKERAAVRRSAVEKILSGWLPDAADLYSND